VRFLSLLKKTMLENFRDWKVLTLSLSFAPLFVFLMYFYFGDSLQTYGILVINHDQGVKNEPDIGFNAGEGLIARLEALRYPEGKPILGVRRGEDRDEALKQLRDGSADLVVEIPVDFSRILHDSKRGRPPRDAAKVRTWGNFTSLKTILAAVWSDTITYGYALDQAGIRTPIDLQVHSAGARDASSDFDMVVPGLLGLSLMMLMFTAAASIIKEKDKSTLVRLRISNMTTGEWFAAVGVTQIVIGVLSLTLTYLSAAWLGFKSTGSLWAVLAVGVLTCLSIIAISVGVAAVLRTAFDLWTIGCFPFFILMFFSGGMFPLPRLTLFNLGGISVMVNDFLPTTHTIRAFDKILNRGAGTGDVMGEMAAIALLTLIFYGAGTWLFNRRHMRAL